MPLLLERLSGGLDNRGEDSLGSKCGLQATPQVREHGIRVIALAIHQAIDHALQTSAERLKEDRDQAGGKQRNEGIPERMQQRAQDAHHEDIHSDDDRCEETIHQCTIDDDVDIPQPIAQHGEPKREWEEEREAGTHNGCQGQLIERPIGRTVVAERWKEQKPIPANGDYTWHSETEDHPFGLLPLHWARYMPVAVQLNDHKDPQLAEKHEIANLKSVGIQCERGIWEEG